MLSPQWLRAAAALSALVVGTTALAVTGVVEDSDGKPIQGARVCHFQKDTGLEHYCIETDENGYFDVVSTDEMPIRISATGFFPQQREAQGHHEVVLLRSPTLVVRLVEASSGEPIDAGEVYVVYPTATKKGPFPTNRSGVRIARLLDPGEVRVIARAKGFEDSDPQKVELEPGKESEATLRLRRRTD
jgi:hypothetical protein